MTNIINYYIKMYARPFNELYFEDLYRRCRKNLLKRVDVIQQTFALLKFGLSRIIGRRVRIGGNLKCNYQRQRLKAILQWKSLKNSCSEYIDLAKAYQFLNELHNWVGAVTFRCIRSFIINEVSHKIFTHIHVFSYCDFVLLLNYTIQVQFYLISL